MGSYARNNYEVHRKRDFYVLHNRPTGESFGKRYATREEAQKALDEIIARQESESCTH